MILTFINSFQAIIDKINQLMIKRRYSGLNFDGEEIEFDAIPGLKEAGWTQKTYEQAKYK